MNNVDPRRSESATVTWRSYVEGPRWASFGSAFRDRVWSDADLQMVTIEDEKRLLRTTTRFVIRGPHAAVKRLQRDVLEGIDEWNDR